MSNKYHCVLSEKEDMAITYAAALGGVYIDGIELTFQNKDKLLNKIKAQNKKEGKLQGVAKKSVFKGQNIVYTWCVGHIIKLYDAKDYDESYAKWQVSKFPFIPKEFKRKVITGFEGRFNIIKKCLNDCELFIQASDSDREGTLISLETSILAGFKDTKRIKRLWYNEINEAKIIEAFNNLLSYQEMIPLYEGAMARQYSDNLVGINTTVIATCLYSSGGGKSSIVSLGRVQTPTLTMVVEREKEILNFKPEKYYQIEGEFLKEGDIYKGILGIDKVNKFKNIEEVNKILSSLKNINTANIKEIEKKEKKESPPQFFDLGSLQDACSKLYKFPIKKTKDIIQKLYESSLLTYPRTDNKFISVKDQDSLKDRIAAVPDNYKDIRDNIIKNNNYNLGTRYIKDTDAPHTAIIIGTKKADLSKLSEDEQKVYNLVVKSMLMPFLGSATWEEATLITDMNGYEFLTKGKILKSAGFRVLSRPSKDTVLPNVNKGEIVEKNKVSALEKLTTPPERFTDNTLKNAMENGTVRNMKALEKEGKISHEYVEAFQDRGIGTPATRDDIIEKLILVEYIKRTKNNELTLTPTEKGMWVIDNIPLPDLKSVELTAQWEYRLRQIEKGKESYNRYMEEVKEYTIKICEELKNTKANNVPVFNQRPEICKCPIPGCGGSIIEGKKGFGCSNWKEKSCKFVIWKSIASKIITPDIVKKLVNDGKTNTIKGLKRKDGSSFEAALKLTINADGTNTVGFDSEEIKCKLCNGHMIKGKKVYFCSNFNNTKCGFRVPIEFSGKKITSKMLIQLIDKGETGQLTFKRKDGGEYKDKMHLIIKGNDATIKMGYMLKK